MRHARLTVVFAAVGLIVLPAMAQDQDGRRAEERRRGPRMSPEQARAVWELQARSVATELGLAEAAAGGVGSAYLAARKSYAEAIAAARQQRRDEADGQGPVGRDGRGGGRFTELRDAERARLQSALAAHVEGDDLKKATAVLSVFDRSYDGMTHVLIGFELGDDKTLEAMAAINKHTAGRSKLANMDREIRRDAMMDMRDDLKASLSVVLDDEQLEAFEQSIRRGGERRQRDI